MGLSLHIALAAAPPWPALTAAMAARGVPVAMRLVDGQPAFPDESPPDGWRELRVASGTGPALRMITLRRSPAGLELITWGNADESSLKLRDAIAAVLGSASATAHEGDPS